MDGRDEVAADEVAVEVKRHKRSKHRTTVVTFKEDLTKTTYWFNSKPDAKRICDEATKDGIAALLLFSPTHKGTVLFMTAPFNEAYPTGLEMPRSHVPIAISVIHTVLGARP